MKWSSGDVDKYSQSKEYVDTAVVPLTPISLNSDFKSTAAKGEFIHYVSTELERQLKGRVFLFPTLSYLKNNEHVIHMMEDWKSEIQKEFKYIIFLTSDESIKETKSDVLEDHVVWLPTVPFEHMDDQLKRKLLQDQVEQILNILLQSWNK
ncbi:YpiF family protein [Metabacillus litoralis]|uniref:YpiF family protein n=1 Tax=Metabacillus litoralis TaxID=152268 RepID=UPI001CFCF23B|nr:YpiF family protein [Metabacillus litoralis]